MDGKGSIPNVDGPSVLKIELHVPRQELERKIRETPCVKQITYRGTITTVLPTDAVTA
jgi:hypothetical protein